jgi:hypothetical protein
MGMDVFGVSPTTEKGEYFRNNVWWWRPLWEYCIYVAPDICSKVYGHTNDGDGLDAAESLQLSEILFTELWNGRTLQYQKDYYQNIADLPREKCTICNGTGIRDDQLGIDNGWPLKELDPEVQILTGRTHGSCNACKGIGTNENWAASYPFSVENVAQFAQFCAESGGFQIC